MKLKVVLEPSEEGGFTVHVPSLPGCISEGDSKEEALKNIKEAIENLTTASRCLLRIVGSTGSFLAAHHPFAGQRAMGFGHHRMLPLVMMIIVEIHYDPIQSAA